MGESANVAEPFAMPTRPNQRVRYKRVMDATIQLAAEGGYDGVQMRSVAERSGVALATVYSYFQSRDNLVLRATMLWSRDIVYQAYEPASAPDGPELEADVIRLLKLHADHPSLLDAFVRAGLTRDPHAMQARREISAEWWVGRGPNFHVLGPEIAKLAPRILNDAFYAGAVRWAFGEITLDDVAERVRTVVRMLVRASSA